MAAYLPEPPYDPSIPIKLGILLVNLGSPEAPTPPAVRAYLKQFLSDPRVVEIPTVIWWPILNGVILPFRSKKSASRYSAIWMKEGAPLKVYTEKQAKLLRGYLGEQFKQPMVVDYAMRYGQPSIETKLSQLKQQGCDRIIVLPLYPQYAASSSGAAFDEVFRTLSCFRNMPAIQTINHFYDQPHYIQALAKTVNQAWVNHGRPDILIMSFHGIPRFSVTKGDPYEQQCQTTARLLAEALGLVANQYQISFQSRFGRAEWLKPYTTETLVQLAKAGVKRVDVVCPGFVSDCLETLEEIAIEAKALFLSNGGQAFYSIPCLNDHPTWIEALTEIVIENSQGWLTQTDSK